MNPNKLFDLIQVLHIKVSYSTKNEYFPEYIQSTTIYLLKK
jgi:hypothetical protein